MFDVNLRKPFKEQLNKWLELNPRVLEDEITASFSLECLEAIRVHLSRQTLKELGIIGTGC